jgi:hypothetical protein
MSMHDGVYYKFEERETYENKIINVDDFMDEMESSFSSMASSIASTSASACASTESSTSIDDTNIMQLLEYEYSKNYNVKSLSQIMDYYELSKKNMRKDEMIQLIVLFEVDPKNLQIVNRRYHMWNYMNELKQDRYFSKFILFNV